MKYKKKEKKIQKKLTKKRNKYRYEINAITTVYGLLLYNYKINDDEIEKAFNAYEKLHDNNILTDRDKIKYNIIEKTFLNNHGCQKKEQ